MVIGGHIWSSRAPFTYLGRLHGLQYTWIDRYTTHMSQTSCPQYRPKHLVVGSACVHMSDCMSRACGMKYAKPTGHVPQLFYDAWHDSKGRFESRFLRLIAILPVVEPGGPITGPKWGWTSTVVIYGHDWVGQSTRDLYQKPQRSPRRSYRGRVGSEKNPTFGRQDDRVTGRNQHFPGLVYGA